MKKNQLILLYVFSAVAVVVVFFIKPIAQPQQYHDFADGMTWFSIPNFWNVATNLPFAVIGILGCNKINSLPAFSLKSSYAWFFVGIFLTGFGSGYYHFNPNDNTLIWDRLPMTLSFMSFLSIVIGEFIDANSGKRLLYPFLVTGVLSIVYWIISEDLRMYLLVQFLPIVLVLVILFLSKSQQQYRKYFWLIIVSYVIAKFLESYDLFVYSITYKTISGHSLKHIAAAFAPFLFYKFTGRKFTPDN